LEIIEDNINFVPFFQFSNINSKKNGDKEKEGQSESINRRERERNMSFLSTFYWFVCKYL
jgi:hypothetical protein